MYCRKCGKEIKEGNQFCTNCGTSIHRIKDNRRKKYIIAIIFIVIIAIMGIVWINALLNQDYNIEATEENITTENKATEDDINKNAIQLNKKYKCININDPGIGKAEMVFDEDNYELSVSDKEFEITISVIGEYSQNQDNITIRINTVTYTQTGMEKIGEKIEEHCITVRVSNNGRNITLARQNGEDTVFQLSDEIGTITQPTVIMDGILANIPNDFLNQENNEDTNKNLLKQIEEKYPDKIDLVCYNDYEEFWVLDDEGKKMYFEDLKGFEEAIKEINK